MSLWQFQAYQQGYRRAHMSEDERAKDMSEDEFEALGGILDQFQGG
ncbi:hypothetical protein [Jiella pelagia]|uniref:Uncharacterized protein n=1 Tax=Jiella pelagia TaxID=2986949 RepID=A0ABY7BV75_9HYPH|nr:hypothetical protein [Jiella pelagia]WAP67232.1 hypothetical protein OH818_16785 [Jiella pelagia]